MMAGHIRPYIKWMFCMTILQEMGSWSSEWNDCSVAHHSCRHLSDLWAEGDKIMAHIPPVVIFLDHCLVNEFLCSFKAGRSKHVHLSCAVRRGRIWTVDYDLLRLHVCFINPRCHGSLGLPRPPCHPAAPLPSFISKQLQDTDRELSQHHMNICGTWHRVVR
jgi:hypothetical protein